MHERVLPRPSVGIYHSADEQLASRGTILGRFSTYILQWDRVDDLAK